jgi:hypothetical protein
VITDPDVVAVLAGSRLTVLLPLFDSVDAAVTGRDQVAKWQRGCDGRTAPRSRRTQPGGRRYVTIRAAETDVSVPVHGDPRRRNC